MEENVKNEHTESDVEIVVDDIVQNDVNENNNEETVVEKDEATLEIERLTAENDVLADRVLRAQAELQNIQKRQAKERADLIRYQSQKLASALLPVLDSLEHALAVEVVDEQGQALKKGIEMAYTNFVAALQAEGVESIVALGEKFDPTKHQAIQQMVVEGVEADTVTQEYQKGYTLHDRVLRPSMVVVSQ